MVKGESKDLPKTFVAKVALALQFIMLVGCLYIYIYM